MRRPPIATKIYADRTLRYVCPKCGSDFGAASFYTAVCKCGQEMDWMVMERAAQYPAGDKDADARELQKINDFNAKIRMVYGRGAGNELMAAT